MGGELDVAFVIIDLEFNNLSEIHKYYPNIYKDIPNLKELDLVNEIIEKSRKN